MITLLLFVLIILLIVFLVINYNKLKYQNKMFDSLNQTLNSLSKDILEIKSDIKFDEKLLSDYVTLIGNITNTVKGLTSPVKTIAGEIDKIKDIHSVIYKIQANDTIIKNMVEETRNIVKASKTRKSTKVSKTSSKEKSANSEALKGSQVVNSSNK